MECCGGAEQASERYQSKSETEVFCHACLGKVATVCLLCHDIGNDDTGLQLGIFYNYEDVMVWPKVGPARSVEAGQVQFGKLPNRKP